MRKSLRLPMLTIISNAGLDPHPIVEKVISNEGDFGYDALNNEFGNLVEKGILDPTKVRWCKIYSSKIAKATKVLSYAVKGQFATDGKLAKATVNKNVFCKIVLLIVKLLWGENNFIGSYLYICSFYVSFQKKIWYILNVKH